MPKRLLFVDDEPGIRETMPPILRMHGFDVTTAATVTEALQAIAADPFDVLISDLNIGHPADGFMVVHAMRQRHPDCVTFILTGYPAFETALQAIRSQVDDYLIKPASPTALISAIEDKLKMRQRRPSLSSRGRVASILRDHAADIEDRVLQKIKDEPPLDALSLAERARMYPVQPILEELAKILKSPGSDHSSHKLMQAARLRGQLWHEQGYTIPLLVENVRLLEKAIFEIIHENMLSLDLSFLMLDLARLNDTMVLQLKASLAAYLEAAA
jgi:YesN/AraC family two-component response regulator